jgi:hypothetical protein
MGELQIEGWRHRVNTPAETGSATLARGGRDRKTGAFVLVLYWHNSETQMRYFLDAEFNGFGGQLISLALVPEEEASAPFYEVLPCTDPIPWVTEHVLPVLQKAPITRAEMTAKLAAYLRDDEEPAVIGDWPEDIAHLALLMVTGLGWRMPSETLTFELRDLPLFDSASLSKVPHNACSDAMALRDYVLGQTWPVSAREETGDA